MTGYEAVVIGGGIVGASVGYHLARDGVDALVVDRADAGRATAAGAGIVSPATSSRSADDAWFELGRRASRYYPDLAATLGDATDGPTGYSRCGLLSVALDEETVEPFETAHRRTEARAERFGVPDPVSMETLPAERARALFPPLADPRRALLLRDAARVDGRAFARSLLRAGEAAGLTVERGSVEVIDVEGGTGTGIELDDGRYVSTDAAVVAGGAWSPTFGSDLGLDLPVSPTRGQLVHLDLRDAAGDRSSGPADRPSGPADWPIVAGFRGHYLVPWPDGRVVAGATREPDAGFDRRPTAAGVRTVLDEALRVAPGLADAGLAAVRVGLRPTAADRRPILGRVPGVEGAFLATGHGATGLTIGPYTGKLVADAVAGREPEIDLEPFRVERFG